METLPDGLVTYAYCGDINLINYFIEICHLLPSAGLTRTPLSKQELMLLSWHFPTLASLWKDCWSIFLPNGDSVHRKPNASLHC